MICVNVPEDFEKVLREKGNPPEVLLQLAILGAECLRMHKEK
jgi:hypothetical protein